MQNCIDFGKICVDGVVKCRDDLSWIRITTPVIGRQSTGFILLSSQLYYFIFMALAVDSARRMARRNRTIIPEIHVSTYLSPLFHTFPLI